MGIRNEFRKLVWKRRIEARPAVFAAYKYFGRANWIAEIGVARGRHAFAMVRELKPQKTFLIDIIKEPCIDDMFRNVNYNFLEKSSIDASFDFPDEAFDFVYIDAEHTSKAIIDDIDHWYPKVVKGGILAGHDYMGHHKHQMKETIDKRLGIVNWTYTSGKQKNADWWIIK